MGLPSRTHAYRGTMIEPCESARQGQDAYSHRGPWIVRTYHKTGVRWSDQECPHFGTLADARRHLDDVATLEA